MYGSVSIGMNLGRHAADIADTWMPGRRQSDDEGRLLHRSWMPSARYATQSILQQLQSREIWQRGSDRARREISDERPSALDALRADQACHGDIIVNSTLLMHSCCAVSFQSSCRGVRSHIDPIHLHGSRHEARCLRFAQKHSHLIAQCRTPCRT